MSQSLVNEGRFPHKKSRVFILGMKDFSSRNPSLMRAGFHILGWYNYLKNGYCVSQSLVNEGRFPPIGRRWSYGVHFISGRNPSLMRAGFHNALMDMITKEKELYRSQSLVNEGRFPQVIIGISIQWTSGIMSQSLVNEGRFPPIDTRWFVEEVKRVAESQSLVNEGRFPQVI